MFKIRPLLSSLAQNCLVGTSLIILGFWWLPACFSQPAHTLNFLSRKSFFEKSPRLIRAATSFRGPAALANYSFTIELPQDVGAPMSALTIVQQPNVEEILLYPNKSRVFQENSPGDRSITAQIIDISSETPGVKVIFEQPIQPGTTVTVSLRARNPLYGGIYQFGLTAFPISENNDGLYLGSGRLQFSQPGGGNN